MKTLEFDFCTITLRADGIIHMLFKEEFEVDIEHVKMINAELGKFGNGKKYPLLLEGGKLTNVSLEGRKFVAQKDSNPYSSAEAIIVKSLPQRLIGNFYMKFNKPGRPTKLFPNVIEAVNWLKGFL